MKNQILKLLRQIFVKEKKQLPMGVEAAGLDIKAEKIAKQLSDAGYQGPINLDFIKRIDQSLKPTFEKVVPKASGEVFDLTGKKIHPGETIMGGKGIGMIADDYADLKEEYFRRIMTSTDEALNTFLKTFTISSTKLLSILPNCCSAKATACFIVLTAPFLIALPKVIKNFIFDISNKSVF